MKFKLFFLIVLLLVISSNTGLAETVCTENAFGNTTCKDSEGNTVIQTPRGFSVDDTWTDNHGRKYTRDTTYDGTIAYSRSDGYKFHGRQDVDGTMIWADNHGHHLRLKTKMGGERVYTDDKGHRIVCRDRPSGGTVCR